jgi:magnesium chelatase family protein
VIAARIVQARERQEVRFRRLRSAGDILCNAEADGALLDQAACPEPQAVSLLRQAAERLGLSGRGYHRVLRVARTIADLAASDRITRSHVAEAVGYRPS